MFSCHPSQTTGTLFAYPSDGLMTTPEVGLKPVSHRGKHKNIFVYVCTRIYIYISYIYIYIYTYIQKDTYPYHAQTPKDFFSIKESSRVSLKQPISNKHVGEKSVDDASDSPTQRLQLRFLAVICNQAFN